MKISAAIQFVLICLPSISLACLPSTGTRLKTPNELFDAAVYAVYGQVSIPDGSTIKLKVNCVFKSPSLLSPSKPTVEQLMGGSSDIQLTGRFLFNPKSGRPQESCAYTPEDGSSYLFFLTRKDGNRFELHEKINPGWYQAMLPLPDGDWSILPTSVRQKSIGDVSICPTPLRPKVCADSISRFGNPSNLIPLNNIKTYEEHVVVGQLFRDESKPTDGNGGANMKLTVSCVLKTTAGLKQNDVISLQGFTDPDLFVRGTAKGCFLDPTEFTKNKNQKVVVFLTSTSTFGVFAVDASVGSPVRFPSTIRGDKQTLNQLKSATCQF